MQQPRLSIVMVDGSFRERFDSIDFLSTQTLPPEDYEIIWVEYYDRVHPQLAERVGRYGNVRAITLGREGEYHASYCFNRGIVEARGDVLVIPDADVIAEPAFLETALADHDACDRLVTYFHRCNEPEDAHRDGVDLDHLRRVGRVTNPANHGGCLSVRKHWLLQINGYDQHELFATGFHANDKDVYTRLNNLGLYVRWHPVVRLYHPWHPMTGVVTPHYQSQLDTIHWRGQKGATLPFEGIDPSRNAEVPPHLARRTDWLGALRLTPRERALRKIRRGIRGILDLNTQPAPVRPDQAAPRRAA